MIRSKPFPVHARRLILGAVLSLGGAAFAGSPPAFANTHWAHTHTRAQPPGQAHFRGRLPVAEALDIVVALKVRNQGRLDNELRNLTTPGNPAFQHWRRHDELVADYAPDPFKARAVADYLADAGFTQVRIGPDRLLIAATGTAAVIRRAFHTELARFERDGRTGVMNTAGVQIPDRFKDTVLSVLDLQTLYRMQPMARRADRIYASGSVHGIDPVDFPGIYNAAGLAAASNGSVGIIADGDLTQTVADLHQFESQHGLPVLAPTVIQVGLPSSDTSGTSEWDLDSQDIQAMAGGQLGQMSFYAAHSMLDGDIIQALDRAVSDNTATVINVSLGECESTAYNDGAMAAEDQILQLAIAQGQTVSASSGDTGAMECGSPPGSAAGAAYPASSPYVIAVGGTTLSLDANGGYAGETAWSETGGSPSLYELIPAWQSGVVADTYRGVPDIAFDADPASGAVIVVNGQSQQWGGTSLASPLFVGGWLRIQAANNARLGFPASWIYRHGAQNTPAYHDVVSGSNGGYSAAAGWDYTTGFGSFDVAATALLTRSSITVTASSPAVAPGRSITLTATVTGNSPTGTVQFLVNGLDLGSPVTLANGVATLTTTQLPAGNANAVSAVYSGDANDAGSTTLSAVFVIVPSADNDVPMLPPWAMALLALCVLSTGVRGSEGIFRRSRNTSG